MLSAIPVTCPPRLLSQAKSQGAISTAVVCAASPIALDSARLACDAGLIRPVLLGDAIAIDALAKEIGWASDQFDVIHATSESDAALRAVELVHEGYVQALMKGDIHTDIFMGAIINKDKGIRTGARLCHVFYMTFPESDRGLIISDAAVNIAPDMKTRQAIVTNTVRLANLLGIKNPKIAVISATEQINQAMPSSIAASELSHWVKENFDTIQIAGPLALDNAISPESARIKGIASPVAGYADILVMPSIESGNILFKSLVYYRSACAAGVVMGARVPITLTSRADPPAARLASVALANILASNPK